MENSNEKIMAALEAKLPAQFAIICANCGVRKSTLRDTFLKRVTKLNGDYKMLLSNYHCTKCRKEKNIDFVGQTKVATRNQKTITVNDLADIG